MFSLSEENIGYCAFDDDPWIVRLVDFVKGILTSSSSSSSSTAGHDSPHVVRVIGVCFGHQIVGRALGAPVVRSDAGWEIAVLPMYLTERGKEIFGRSELVSRACAFLFFFFPLPFVLLLKSCSFHLISFFRAGVLFLLFSPP